MSAEWLASPATVALAPVLAVQGLRIRRGTPRLPEAAGPLAGMTDVIDVTGRGGGASAAEVSETPGAAGAAGAAGTLPGGESGPVFRLAVLGESTAAGVGVATHDEGLAGFLAREAAARTGRPVRWQVAARSGVNTRTTTAELVPLLEPADVVVVALGVNELLELNRPRRFRGELRELVEAVRRRLPGVPVVVAGMPPVGRFPALPQPLRAVLGLRARALDHVMREVARDAEGVVHATAEVPVEIAGFFASDGFHPSATGYRHWAQALVRALPGLPAAG
ncbi:SGNH/GDSL hydrolase family protein [Streptosporangium sp. NPDC004379]|uniref:SGNH/GDSL hydrolase family protein n=1 Tax=Streptosporangium sp. NPDC004379 TaxID=3366189 RepID=UPI003684E53B